MLAAAQDLWRSLVQPKGFAVPRLDELAQGLPCASAFGKPPPLLCLGFCSLDRIFFLYVMRIYFAATLLSGQCLVLAGAS